MMSDMIRDIKIAKNIFTCLGSKPLEPFLTFNTVVFSSLLSTAGRDSHW